jgi:hypothetical protein
MDVPELSAGPSRWKMDSDKTSCDTNLRMVSLVTGRRARLWRRMDSL